MTAVARRYWLLAALILLVRIEVSTDGQPLDAWTVGPGPFLRAIDIEASRLAGDGYARLAIAAAREGGGPGPTVAVEQFDLQSEGTAVWAFGDGWHEAEYDRRTRRPFRWSGRRADLLIINADKDLEISLDGDSPMKYFAEPPKVTVAAGGQVLRSEPVAAPFWWKIRVPPDALKGASGTVTISTDRAFRPSDSGVADGRELGLRFFTIAGSR